MRQFSRFAAIIAVLALPAVAGAQRSTIVPQGMSASATLTPGIKMGDVIYTSGQLGTSRDSTQNTIQAQTKKSLENVKAVIEAGGGNMGTVLKCTVFLADMKDFAAMNSVYTTFFTKEPPARSTVAVAALASPTAKVEIECIAAVAK